MSTKSKIKSILTRWSAFFASGGVSLDLAVNDVDRLIKLIMYDERLAARAHGYKLGYADAKKDIEAHSQSRSRTHSAIVSNALVRHFYKR